jgi:hypothetical protein
MGFVTEDINTPERIREFEEMKLISPVTGGPAERWRWMVDRERSLYFLPLGGGFSDIPKLFALVFPGGTATIECEKDSARGLTKWIILRVRISRALAPRAEEIRGLMHEALKAYGIRVKRVPNPIVEHGPPAYLPSLPPKRR